MVNRFEGGVDSSPEQEKSLLVAMAVKRWVKGTPNAQIVGGVYISSRDIESALLGDGLRVITQIDLTDEDGFQRISAEQDSVGFDEGLEITKVSDNCYQIKLHNTA